MAFKVAPQRVIMMLAWGLYGVVACLVAASAFRSVSADDLAVYVGALSRWERGDSLYDFARENGDRFTYPPFAALVLSPLAHVSFESARRGLIVLEILCIAVMGAIGHAAVGRKVSDPRLPLLLSILLMSAPARSNLRFGQVSVFISLATLAGLAYAASRPLRAGVALGLATAVKLTPAVAIVGVFLGKRTRAGVCAGISLAVATLVGTLVLWRDSRRYWLRELTNNSRIIHFDSPGNQSLQAVLARAQAPLSAIIWAVLVAFLAWRAYVKSSECFRHNDTLGAFVVLGALTVIASPVSWTHHQFALVFAVLARVSGHAVVNHAWRITVFIVMTFSISDHTVFSFLTENTRFWLAVTMILIPTLNFGVSPSRRSAVDARPE